MKLEKYLQAIEECPDKAIVIENGQVVHRLTAEFGIEHDWPIFLNSDLKKIIKFLEKLEYEIKKYNGKKIGVDDGMLLSSESKDLEIVISKKIEPYATASAKMYKGDASNLERIFYQKQMRDYNLRIQLYQNGIPFYERKIAEAVIEIGRHASSDNIPLCFPKSVGLKNPKNYSQIVWYP